MNYRKKLIRHKRRKRDRCMSDIEFLATLSIMLLIFLLMVVIYILQAGPV